MHPFVDKPGSWIVRHHAGPGGDQVVVDRRSANMASIRRTVFQIVHHGADAGQSLFSYGLPHRIVGVISAFAQRFFLGCLGVITAQCEGQNLLHETGARAARARSLGMISNVVQGK